MINKKTWFNPNAFLLAFLVLTVFIVPVVQVSYHEFFYDILFSCIFVLSALSIRNVGQKNLLAIALLYIILTWLASRLDIAVLTMCVRIVVAGAFLYIIIRLIKQTAAAKDVNIGVIADSISGYLLVGMAYTMIAHSIARLMPGAYHFPAGDDLTRQTQLSEMFYYVFVTYSSTGYGDITPVLPAARSFSTLISVSGQMYVAIIIALLVGKFSSTSTKA